MRQISIRAEIDTIAGKGRLVDQQTKTITRKLHNGPVVPLLMAGVALPDVALADPTYHIFETPTDRR